jgi:hypothetical protein
VLLKRHGHRWLAIRPETVEAAKAAAEEKKPESKIMPLTKAAA